MDYLDRVILLLAGAFVFGMLIARHIQQRRLGRVPGERWGWFGLGLRRRDNNDG